MKSVWKKLLYVCKLGVLAAPVAITPFINEAMATGGGGSGTCSPENMTPTVDCSEYINPVSQFVDSNCTANPNGNIVIGKWLAYCSNNIATCLTVAGNKANILYWCGVYLGSGNYCVNSIYVNGPGITGNGWLDDWLYVNCGTPS